MKDSMKPYYGNWVPAKLLALLYAVSLGSAVLCVLAVACHWATPLCVVMAVALCVSLLFACLMTAFHHAFSFSGGGMMGRVHEFVVERHHG